MTNRAASDREGLPHRGEPIAPTVAEQETVRGILKPLAAGGPPIDPTGRLDARAQDRVIRVDRE